MCGILGVASPVAPLPTEGELALWRERISRRGPDGSGAWSNERVVLAHSRLSVRDPRGGAQPVHSGGGRWVLVYNGELYNDAELRAELRPTGGWRDHSDTETVVAALEAWGVDAFPRLRGMFALAAFDTHTNRLVLARDPLGIKPLYWWSDGRSVVFGSEPRVVLAHPDVPVRPNLTCVSAYLTTLRTTLGEHSMFEGVHTLPPGAVLTVDLDREPLKPVRSHWHRGRPVDPEITPEAAADRLGAALADSVHRHLLSDVPVALMLSGGLDSAVLASLAAEEAPALHAYTSGALGERGGDVESSRLLAQQTGLTHHEVPLDEEGFERGWTHMVHELGVPLSTPNEVAIHAMSRRLRADGHVVALSGEGSDELLGGYGGFLEAAAAHAADTGRGAAATSGGRFQLDAASWVPLGTKAHLFQPRTWEGLDADAELLREYDRTFDRCVEDVGGAGGALDAHLRFLRHVNLPRLLRRLDTATMLASVEGRTPFADIEIVDLCESFPMAAKFRTGGEAESSSTKLALRRAFEHSVPRQVIERPKVSFALPFHDWLGNRAETLGSSEFARSIFEPQLLEAVVRDPAKSWRFAWPMINVALWGERWF